MTMICDSTLCTVCVVVCAIVCAVLFFLYYVGAFYKVVVTSGRPYISEVKVAYKFHVGNYKSVGPHFAEIVKLCPNLTTIGIYYDDPKKVDPNKCRYILGAVLAEGFRAPINQETMDKMEENGFKFAEFPKVEAAVRANYPFVNVVSMIFAVMKVYPRLEKYIKEERLNAHPFLEICENNYTHFMVPLSKQDKFYVSEVKGMLKDE